MSVEIENYGFYKVDMDYVKYLNSKDSEVFFETSPDYERKPYLGIITQLGDCKYCIPLTSAKGKHLNWSNVTDHNYVLYEMVTQSELREKDIYKQIGQEDKYKKILAVLEIKKMIPVTDSLCQYIDFDIETDIPYKVLLEKEYNFIRPLKNDILRKAQTLYEKQVTTKVIKEFYCNFTVLENALANYKK